MSITVAYGRLLQTCIHEGHLYLLSESSFTFKETVAVVHDATPHSCPSKCSCSLDGELGELPAASFITNTRPKNGNFGMRSHGLGFFLQFIRPHIVGYDSAMAAYHAPHRLNHTFFFLLLSNPSAICRFLGEVG